MQSTPRHASRRLLALALFLAAVTQVDAAETAGVVAAKNGLVVSATAVSSEIGRDVLKRGGNAVDAAVATAFALAVVHPEAGNIGGGGFMMVYPADGSPPECIEYRETAPAAATQTMFSAEDSSYGPKIVGVPGTVRGLALAHRRYGRLPWSELAAPAVKLAADGFTIDQYLADSLNSLLAESGDFPELLRVYGKAGGIQPWQAGDQLALPDLARTLERIAAQGADGFYQGPVAEKIVTQMRDGGGLITREDLADYRAHVRRPIHGTYRGYDIYGPPPPSSGGVCLIEMLNILENFDLDKYGRDSDDTWHLMVEAMRRAFRDRAVHLGDPDFVEIPEFLTEKEYARRLARGIDLRRATPSEELAADIPLVSEGTHTTHFSVIDGRGMAVSNTYTLEHSYGSRVVVRGAGFLLNDEMGDFNWVPGHTDREGRIGTAANLIAPGKRMLSSQTPVIVAREGQVRLITGSPGGRTIINTVLAVVLNVIEFEMDAQAAVDAPRFHHGWFPDQVTVERFGQAPSAGLLEGLKNRGHDVVLADSPQGSAHTILVRSAGDRTFLGAADYRRTGHASGY